MYRTRYYLTDGKLHYPQTTSVRLSVNSYTTICFPLYTYVHFMTANTIIRQDMTTVTRSWLIRSVRYG